MSFNVLSWNIEGCSRNVFNLMKILKDEDPSLIFISEPWMHLSDAPLILNEFKHQYSYYLNSEDRHDPLLSLSRSRAYGGTLALWKKELDAYITVLEPPSSHILPLLLEKPGYQKTIHITIYLPTAGKEVEFMKELSALQNTIDKLCDDYPDSLIFIRGDANASLFPRDNNKRDALFMYFMDENKFANAPINHNTYHHFTNNGMSDSCIDVIIFSTVNSDGIPSNVTESVCKVICGKTNPTIDSSHDALLTTFSLFFQAIPEPSSDNIEAPRVPLTRQIIIWSEHGISLPSSPPTEL